MAILNNSNAISTGGYDVNNSLRFRASASAYLNRTPASATNRRTYTYSFWTKYSTGSSDVSIFSTYGGSAGQFLTIGFIDSGKSLTIDQYNGSTRDLILYTTQVFRDPSAWYHVVVAVDTTQATSSNRIKFYVNGNQVTAFASATYPSLNFDTYVNTTQASNIGRRIDIPGQYYDGYLAEVNFIDGSAKTPSDFGATDATTGVWKPKAYTGTYGTNGFYLPFPLNSTSTYAGSFNGSRSLSVASNAVFGYGTSDFTIEGWFYFNNLNTQSVVSNLTNGSSTAPHIYYDSSSGLSYYTVSAIRINGGALQANNWYHIALCRSGSSTRMFVNGIQVGSTYSDSNNYGTSNPFVIGDYGSPLSGSAQFNGNISNVRVVKGTALYTSNFVPSSIALTAISGTSILTLQNSTIVDNSGNSLSITNTGTVTTATATPFVANIFGDNSGNNNNWVGNNINYSILGTTYDAMKDSPTNTSATVANYANINPLAGSTIGTIDNGNLRLYYNGANWSRQISTIGMTTGKWYAEFTISQIGDNSWQAGVTSFVPTRSSVNQNGESSGSGFLNAYQSAQSGAIIWNNTTRYNLSVVYSAGDVIGVAFDADTGIVKYYRNGSQVGNSGGYTIDNIGSPWYFQMFSKATDGTGSYGIVDANFGQRPFAYTPPTGYVALNTYNLPTPTVLKGNTVMDATLWTGNGASSRSITNAASFRPDFVWIKQRSGTEQHQAFDSIRGATKVLNPNLTNAESTDVTKLTAFNSDGFSLGSELAVNGNGSTYVGWQWQAGQNSTSSNTSGSITSTVSVNTTAGFSVVTFTATGSNATVGHGLGVAPKMIITKQRNVTGSWATYHESLGNTKLIYLDSTGAALGPSSAYWNNTSPTSTVFTFGGALASNTNTIVAYCWAAISGYSAFTSYTGNGSTDGPFIFLGFRPKFVMIKRTDGGTNNWVIFDSSRNTYNATGKELKANTSAAEYDGDSTNPNDFLSNGLKIRHDGTAMNVASGTYIVAAWAENPFKNSNAR
jgi:hypothetical protein